ncbi:aldehyde dehydrogenase family protein [Rhodococcus sp. KBS0724]|uniref:aldehyde dehydrogenase family protein n=1 Tax=Rhodococcus sp. KBS0724 TaxID=1179674 RepID=UPI00110E1332|nr:aldehyde dehydrogenase family protein [Rhodococcus sp. KBS0724]TSD40366.1 aldehyde dehydrogenase family protein [Rhodococcus sp. KBS0724]
MTDFAMTINGVSAPSANGFAVLNPATNSVVATAPECSEDQLDAAMDAAAEAHRHWRLDDGVRRVALRAAADVIVDSEDELAAVLTVEQGKPLADSRMEVRATALWFRYYADFEVPAEPGLRDDRAIVEIRRQPLGVVVAITPWNFPLALAAWKMAPALRAGNTVVLKPSPHTPLATLKLGELLAGVLPPGVLNVVSGSDPLGARMTSHAIPRKISFTGSIATGKRVAASAANDLKRVTLELGGNDPAILLDDVDPSFIAERLFWSAFHNNGQVCMAVKRVYVPERLHDEVVEALAAIARSVQVGDGTDPKTQLGPINNRQQFDIVSGLIGDALDRGGFVAAGGRAIDGPGLFHEPTILAGVTDGTAIVDQEQFGPVLPVVSYRDLDEVVERANGTHFGLSGSVWGADEDLAAEVATRLECGTAWVNTHLAVRPSIPFGGMKWSGLGVENGAWGYNEFTSLRVLHRAVG